MGERARIEPERRREGLKENGGGGNRKDEMDPGGHEMRTGLTCRSKGGEHVGAKS